VYSKSKLVSRNTESFAKRWGNSMGRWMGRNYFDDEANELSMIE
jgi:hypothetical protein